MPPKNIEGNISFPSELLNFSGFRSIGTKNPNQLPIKKEQKQYFKRCNIDSTVNKNQNPKRFLLNG
jgi:hypothetical protein